MKTTYFGKPGFCIETDIIRPSAEIIGQFAKLPVALLGDGMGRFSVMDSAIKPLEKAMKFCGTAITVEVHPADNLMIHAAMKIAKKGDILVINARGNVQNGIYGDILNSAAKRKELGGIVVDGAVRDSVEIMGSCVPVFSRGVSPLGGGKEGPGRVNIPISCGGVVVNPGDIIVGDADGVVVVPEYMQSAALEGAVKKEAAEAKRLDTITHGADDEIYPTWLIPTLREKGILKENEEL